MKQCRKNYLCDFRIDLDNDEVQVERCVFCGRKEVYNKARMDNKKYADDHLRDIIQPRTNSKDFERIYGKDKLKQAMKGRYSSKYDDKEGFIKDLRDSVKNKKTFL